MSAEQPSSPLESCTVSTCDIAFSYSSYLPTFEGNLLYALIFAVCLGIHLFHGFRTRTFGFTATFVAGLALEIAGYTGRLLMHYNPFKQDNFLLYLVPLTIAPAFLSAGVYLCLARIIVLYKSEGMDVSRLKPRTYTLIFVACDFVSLLLQAAGGAIASMAETKKLEDMGINIMIAGLAFQVASMALFMGLAVEVGLKIRRAAKPVEEGVTCTALFKRFLIGKFLFAGDQREKILTSLPLNSAHGIHRVHLHQMRIPCGSTQWGFQWRACKPRSVLYDT